MSRLSEHVVARGMSYLYFIAVENVITQPWGMQVTPPGHSLTGGSLSTVQAQPYLYMVCASLRVNMCDRPVAVLASP